MFGVSYSWYDEKQSILLVSITPDEWNWNDAVGIIQKKVAYIEKVPHEVHVIYKFTFPPRIPKSKMFHRIGELVSMRADNEGLSIFVGTNRLFKTFVATGATVASLYSIHQLYRYVATFEQALNTIKTYEEHKNLAQRA